MIQQTSIELVGGGTAMGQAPTESPSGAVDTSASVDTTTPDFDDFYHQHRPRVAAALSFTLGDDQLGHEAADEAMARAYQRWSEVGRYDNPSGWVYRTGLNWARSWLRRLRRSAPKDRLVARPASSTDRPVDTDLAAALATLSDDHRSVVVLRYFCDWSVDETATALDIAPGTVKSRLSRALDLLRTELDTTDSPDQTERRTQR